MTDIGLIVYWTLMVVFWAAVVWLAIWFMLSYGKKRRRRRQAEPAAPHPDTRDDSGEAGERRSDD